MVKMAHEGHQGIVRTKQLLRVHVWFPGIDKMVDGIDKMVAYAKCMQYEKDLGRYKCVD